MGILTNFLKLLKPEPNDFVDVAKHISENYDKLDENAKSNDETLTNLNNNKLDKGTYPGNASDLNDEISKIASKTVLGRMIVGKGMTADSTGKVSVVSKNDGITVNDNDIQLNTVDNLINTSITKPLSANQGVILDKQDKGVLGGYNGIFPLTVASKNGIYLLPATNKFYVCVENYSGSSLTAPNANFEELSVFQNRNKLENLFKVLYDGEGIESFDISAYQQYNYFLVNVFTVKASIYDGTSTYLLSRHLDTSYGYFMPNSQYNHICLKNNVIEKTSSTTSQLKIKTIVALF